MKPVVLITYRKIIKIFLFKFVGEISFLKYVCTLFIETEIVRASPASRRENRHKVTVRVHADKKIG
jgi:hypothetical protein